MKVRVLLQLVNPEGLVVSAKELLGLELEALNYDPAQLELPLSPAPQAPKRGRGRPLKPAPEAVAVAGAPTTVPELVPVPPVENVPATLEAMQDFISAAARRLGVPAVSTVVKGVRVGGTDEAPQYAVRLSDIPQEQWPALVVTLRGMV